MIRLNDPPRYSDEEAAFLQKELLLACRAKHIPWAYREDLIGEIWVWLMKCGTPPGASRARVRCLVEQFWKRSRPRLLRDGGRKLLLGEICGFDPVSPRGADDGLMASECARHLSRTNQRLAASLCQGANWSEACEAAGIPTGSRSYWRRTLRKRLSVFVAPGQSAARRTRVPVPADRSPSRRVRMTPDGSRIQRKARGSLSRQNDDR
jgi:hypothetical protein